MDLSTKYLGLNLKNPLVASASPLSRAIDNIKKLEDAGVAAVVMYSLFEEQVMHEENELDYYLTRGTESFAESLTYFPPMKEYNLEPDMYLEHIRKAKEAVDIPIIGSLNGVSLNGWSDYAKKIEETGADAIELNTYYIPTDPSLSSADVENIYLENLKIVKDTVQV